MKPHELKFIIIGKIFAPWGIKGELEVIVETDFPQRFATGSKIYINRQPMTIDSSQQHKRRLIIKLDAINSVEDAQKLQGQFVEIHHSQVNPLPEEQYYHYQIIGLQVRTADGEILGNITKILTGESNDNYIVDSTNGEILIPAIEDVIKSIDLNKGYITIEAIEGLLSLNRKGG